MFERAQQDNDIRRSIDACLPGLENRPYFEQDVLRRARGEVKVKKKLSVGLILAIVLILAVVGALAAITLNALYEKTIEKEGKLGRIEDWSAEDKAAFVDLMIDAGIELDEDKLSLLRSGELSEEQRGVLAMEIITDYYPSRDSVLTSVNIIAKEKGPIEYWSLEDKAWLSDMFAQYQPNEVVTGRNLLPTKQDISREQAETVFFNHYDEKYGLTREDFDMDTLSIYFGEGTFDDGIGSSIERHWTINVGFSESISVALKEKLHGRASVGAYISAKGEIINAVNPFYYTWLDEWNDVRQTEAFWTVDGMARIMDEWRPRVEEYRAAGDTIGNELEHLATIDFCLPEEGDITVVKARELANAEVVKFRGIKPDDMRFYYTREACYINDDGVRMYFFRYLATAEVKVSKDGSSDFPSVIVYINAQTGETIDIIYSSGLGISDMI